VLTVVCIHVKENIKNYLYATLRWSEKYTKTDMMYLARSGSWLSLGHIVSVVTTLGLSIFFANFLPKETYGTYKYVLSIIGILTITTLPGVNTYLAQAVARGFEKTIYKALKLKITYGLLGAMLAFGGSFYYYYNDNHTLSLSLLIAGLFIPFMDSAGIYNVYLQSKKLFKASISYFSFNQIVTSLILILTIVLSDNLFIILLAYFGSWTFLRTITFIQALRKHPPSGEIDNNISSYGLHISVAGLLGIIALHIDSLLLFHHFGPAEVALYAFALAPVEQIRGMYKNISPLSLPKLAQRSCKEINKILAPRLFFLLLLGTSIAGIYIVLAPLFFQLLFPQYIEAVLFSQLLSGLIALSLPVAFFASIMQSKISSMPRSWFYWGTLQYAFLIISVIIFIPLYGIYGIIISKYIALFVGAIISVWQWKLLTFNELKAES